MIETIFLLTETPFLLDSYTTVHDLPGGGLSLLYHKMALLFVTCHSMVDGSIVNSHKIHLLTVININGILHRLGC